MGRIRVVSFDVGETLLGPDPGFGALAVRCCADAGERLPDTAAARLEALANEHFTALRQQGRTYSLSEAESRRAWTDLYRAFLREFGVGGERLDRLAAQLYATFSSPSSYRVFDDAWPVLGSLRARGIRLGVVSNWESWLTRLLEASGLAELLDFAIISGQVGIEKPDPRIFAMACRAAAVPAEQICHVGDSLASDVEGARRAGMMAILLDRHGRAVRADTRTIGSLSEILELPELSG